MSMELRAKLIVVCMVELLGDMENKEQNGDGRTGRTPEVNPQPENKTFIMVRILSKQVLSYGCTNFRPD